MRRFRVYSDNAVPDFAIQELSEFADVIQGQDIAELVDSGELALVDGVIASARARWDDSLFKHAPRLKVIARTGIGVENIDLTAAKAYGIQVCNVPDGPTASTAEHAFALMLATAKSLKAHDRLLTEGLATFGEIRGFELSGKRLALIGLGRVGSYVARLASPLGVEIVGYDPGLDPSSFPVYVHRAESIEEAFQAANIVSLHLPLVPQTTGIVTAQLLGSMAKGGVLINAARGGLVDQVALLEAIQEGHLGGAGIDVFDPEPPDLSSALFARRNILVTPHVAASTPEAMAALWLGAIAAMRTVSRGEDPTNTIVCFDDSGD